MTNGIKLVTYQIRLASLQWTYFLFSTTLYLWQQKENMQEQDNAEKLIQTISDIVKFTGKITDMDFDEAATKQYVVLPILRALGWDDRNLETLEVFPETRTNPEGDQTKVDYALQHERRILVLIECKRWREDIEKAEHYEQLAGYIFQKGVDLGVLTNGKTWHFYFAYKTHVPWRNRKFCSIELDNRQDAIANFQKYLSKSKVIDGSAKAEAEKIVAERTGIQWDPKPPSPEDKAILSPEDA